MNRIPWGNFSNRSPNQYPIIAKNVENLTLAENSTTIPKPIPKPKLIKRQNPNTFHEE